MSTAIIRKHNRLTIPKEIMEKLGLHENDPVELDVEDNVLILKPKIVIEKLSIKEMFNDYKYEDTLGEEVNWGRSMGEEVW